MNITCKKCGEEIYSKDDLIVRKIGVLMPRLFAGKFTYWGFPGTVKIFHNNCFTGEKDYILLKIEKINKEDVDFSIFLGKAFFIILFIPFLFVILGSLYFLFAGEEGFDNLSSWFLVFLLFTWSTVYFWDIYKLMKIKEFLNR